MCLFVVFYAFSCFSQNTKIVVAKINTINVNADVYIGYDVLQNYYYTKDNILFKQNGDQILTYMNVSLGKITKVDILNPLKIVVFYEDFNTVVFLDNQLNEKQKILFSDLKQPLVSHNIGLATKNSIWIFDSIIQKIGLYDYEQNKWNSITQPLSYNIQWYQSNFNNFMWTDNKFNCFTIDIFGKIKNLGLIPRQGSILIISNKNYFFHNNGQLYYNYFNDNKLQIKIEIEEKSFDNFSYQNQILSIFTGKEIINYKIQLP